MDGRKNIALVTADSLRADHCGYIGGGDLTPNIDRIASEGLAFENAIAHAGATQMSTTSFLTGRYPHDRPPASTLRELISQHFSAEDTLPERLSRLGYETAVFTANPWTSRYFLDEDLFDHFADFMEETSESIDDVDNEIDQTVERENVVQRMLNWWKGQEMFMDWETMYDRIQAWIDDASEPYFLWVFIVDTHMPYLPPKSHQTQSRLMTYAANAWLYADTPEPFGTVFHDVLTEAYRNTIPYTDEFVGKLSGDVGDDTVVAFHADHGEALERNGVYGHGNTREENLQVPLVVSNAGHGRVKEPFSLRSLPDLLVDIAENGTAQVDKHTAPYVTARLRGSERVIRGRDWKYVQTEDGAKTFRVHGGTATECDLDALRKPCSDLVDAWDRSTEDRRQVMTAAADVVENERV